MPFTPAHPAVVLFLLKSRKFSATGLVIGSMAPDFEYFFKMSVGTRYSHPLAGMFYFDVPVSLLLALVFHSLIKGPLIDNLPAIVRARLQLLRHSDFVTYLKNHVLVFVWSSLLASFLHIVWDAFTHGDGYFVEGLPQIYEGVIVPFDGARYPLWYALQYISTWLGLLIIAIYFFRIPPRAEGSSRVSAVYWLGILVITTIVMWIRFGTMISTAQLGNFVVSFVSAVSVGLLLMGIGFKFTNRITRG